MNYPFNEFEKPFVKFTLPIYSEIGTRKLSHIGTSSLLKINNNYFIVTAAHVLDNCKNNFPCIKIGKELMILEGFYSTITKEKKIRNDDLYDFAFTKLDNETAKSIGLKCFYNIDFYLKTIFINLDLFTFLGYPNSRNKVYDRIVPKPYSFRSSTITLSQYNRLNINSEQHIGIFHKKDNVASSSGEKKTLPSLKGLSGGLILQWIIDIDKITKRLLLRPIVTGLITGKNTNNTIFYGTKIELILKAIYRIFSRNKSINSNIPNIPVEIYKCDIS
jgi:hypothetical protein